MRKLSNLAKHIEALPGISRDQMEAFADLGKLCPSGKDLGNGLEIGRFKYDAVISIERCPARLATLLLAVLVVWLTENDPDRDLLGLGDPDIDVTLEDEQTVFVQITVEFDESLSIVPDKDGPITWDGKQWRVDEVPVDVAEDLEKMENR
ncbi:MAG: phage tail protein [Proteobacteria bacterium]|nr:phage tail protein [Pseudomonadota bacterium]